MLARRLRPYSPGQAIAGGGEPGLPPWAGNPGPVAKQARSRERQWSCPGTTAVCSALTAGCIAAAVPSALGAAAMSLGPGAEPSVAIARVMVSQSGFLVLSAGGMIAARLATAGIPQQDQAARTSRAGWPPSASSWPRSRPALRVGPAAGAADLGRHPQILMLDRGTHPPGTIRVKSRHGTRAPGQGRSRLPGGHHPDHGAAGSSPSGAGHES